MTADSLRNIRNLQIFYIQLDNFYFDSFVLFFLTFVIKSRPCSQVNSTIAFPVTSASSKLKSYADKTSEQYQNRLTINVIAIYIEKSWQYNRDIHVVFNNVKQCLTKSEIPNKQRWLVNVHYLIG